jgi:catechol-2,3-dioxygenase
VSSTLAYFGHETCGMGMRDLLYQQEQHMKVRRIDHIGIIVNDLAAAKEFFVDFGLVVHGEAEMGAR